MYTWFTFLYTWSQHKIINQLYTNKLKKKKQWGKTVMLNTLEKIWVTKSENTLKFYLKNTYIYIKHLHFFTFGEFQGRSAPTTSLVTQRHLSISSNLATELPSNFQDLVLKCKETIGNHQVFIKSFPCERERPVCTKRISFQKNKKWC